MYKIVISSIINSIVLRSLLIKPIKNWKRLFNNFHQLTKILKEENCKYINFSYIVSI